MTYAQAPKTYLNDRGEQVIELGFSGTRLGMNDFQKDFVRNLLSGKTGKAHHGLCIGADAELHAILRGFQDKWRIIGHPPQKTQYKADLVCDELWPEKSYFDRNRDIAHSCNVFIACPKDASEEGGTWNTIKRFRKVLEQEFGRGYPSRQGYIVLPDGIIGQITTIKKGAIDLNNTIQ